MRVSCFILANYAHDFYLRLPGRLAKAYILTFANIWFVSYSRCRHFVVIPVARWKCWIRGRY
jgi:hypothetical protein